jgi:hypothetical protein
MSATNLSKREAGFIWLILGVILVVSELGAGWIFVIIGFVTLADGDRRITRRNRRRTAILTISLLLITLVVTAAYLILIRV